MGLLSGGGLKGLLAKPDFGDALTQARAFLAGDYGTGIDAAARRFRRRRGGSVVDRLAKGTGSPGEVAEDQAGDAPDDFVPAETDALPAAGISPAAAVALPPVGAVVGGHRFMGGSPNDPRSWQPFGFPPTRIAGFPPAFGFTA